MYFSATARVTFGVFVVVDFHPRGASGLFVAGDAWVDEVRGDVPDERAAAGPIHRRAVERGPQRLAQVDVLERTDLVVDADLVVPAARRELELSPCVFRRLP